MAENPTLGASSELLKAQMEILKYKQRLNELQQSNNSNRGKDTSNNQMMESYFRANYQDIMAKRNKASNILTPIELTTTLATSFNKTFTNAIKDNLGQAVAESVGNVLNSHVFGAAYLGLRGLSNTSRINKLAADKYLTRETGTVGRASRALDTISLANRAMYSLPMGLSLLATGTRMPGLKTVQQSLVGNSGALGGILGPLGALMIAQMGLSIWKNAKIRKLQATRKSGSSEEIKYSYGNNIDSVLNTMAARGQIQQADMIKITLLRWIESHTSLLAPIYEDLDYMRQDKEKSSDRAVSSYSDSMNAFSDRGLFDSFMDKVEGSLSKFLATYDPSTQIMNLLFGGKTPKQFQDELAAAYGYGSDKEYVRGQSIKFGINYNQTRLLDTEGRQISEHGTNFESKQLALAVAQFDLIRLLTSETVTIRRAGFGIADNMNFLGPDQTVSGFGKLSDVIQNTFAKVTDIPGLNAIVNIVKGIYNLPDTIMGFGTKMYRGFRDTLLGPITKYSEDAELLLKDTGIYKSEQDKATHFISSALPTQLETVRSVLYSSLEVQMQQLDVQENMLSALGEDIKDRDEYLKNKKELQFFDPITGQYLTKDAYLKAQKERNQMLQAQIETQWANSFAGRAVTGLSWLMGKRLSKEEEEQGISFENKVMNNISNLFSNLEQKVIGIPEVLSPDLIAEQGQFLTRGPQARAAQMMFSQQQFNLRREQEQNIGGRLKWGMKKAGAGALATGLGGLGLMIGSSLMSTGGGLLGGGLLGLGTGGLGLLLPLLLAGVGASGYIKSRMGYNKELREKGIGIGFGASSALAQQLNSKAFESEEDVMSALQPYGFDIKKPITKRTPPTTPLGSLTTSVNNLIDLLNKDIDPNITWRENVLNVLKETKDKIVNGIIDTNIVTVQSGTTKLSKKGKVLEFNKAKVAAFGGNVPTGMSALVGEVGPEIVTPVEEGAWITSTKDTYQLIKDNKLPGFAIGGLIGENINEMSPNKVQNFGNLNERLAKLRGMQGVSTDDISWNDYKEENISLLEKIEKYLGMSVGVYDNKYKKDDDNKSFIIDWAGKLGGLLLGGVKTAFGGLISLISSPLSALATAFAGGGILTMLINSIGSLGKIIGSVLGLFSGDNKDNLATSALEVAGEMFDADGRPINIDGNKKPGVISRSIDKIKNVIGNSSVGKAATKIGKVAGNTKLGGLAIKYGGRALGVAGRAGSRLLGYGSSITGVGGVVAAGLAANDYYQGTQKADEIFGGDSTLAQKNAAGIANIATFGTGIGTHTVAKGIEYGQNLIGGAASAVGSWMGFGGSSTTPPGELSPNIQSNSDVNLKNLHPAVLQNLNAMADEYFAKTGKKLLVVSGFRDYDKQKELFNQYGPGRAASPGNSMHNYGLAFDLDTVQVEEVKSLGLLNKYGFHQPLLNASTPENWHIEPQNLTSSMRANIREEGKQAALSGGYKQFLSNLYGSITSVPGTIASGLSSVGNYASSILGFNSHGSLTDRSGGKFDSIIQAAAQQYGLDPVLLKKQMMAESSGNPQAFNKSSGASGLMQIIPSTAASLGVTNLFDPQQNIFGGAKYMSQLLKQFNSNFTYALAGYNWGPGNTNKWLNAGADTSTLPKETRDYIGKITARYGAYIKGGDGNFPNFGSILTNNQPVIPVTAHAGEVIAPASLIGQELVKALTSNTVVVKEVVHGVMQDFGKNLNIDSIKEKLRNDKLENFEESLKSKGSSNIIAPIINGQNNPMDSMLANMGSNYQNLRNSMSSIDVGLDNIIRNLFNSCSKSFDSCSKQYPFNSNIAHQL